METFFTTSDKLQYIIKSFNLTKTLFVSSIIVGEPHTGKKALAKYLFPNAHIVSGSHKKDIEIALASHDELIITDFDFKHSVDFKSNLGNDFFFSLHPMT